MKYRWRFTFTNSASGWSPTIFETKKEAFLHAMNAYLTLIDSGNSDQNLCSIVVGGVEQEEL